MATDPQSLVSQGKCYTCFGGSVEDAMELALLAQIASGAPAPVLPIPVLTVLNNVISWSVVGVVPGNVGIEKSSDGINFVASSSALWATGSFTVEVNFFYRVKGYSGPVPIGPVTQYSNIVHPVPEAAVTAWSGRVVANGGAAPSQNTINCTNNFYLAIQAAGLLTPLKVVNCIAPDSLIAALTPLFIGPGFNFWTNNGFTGADITINGLQGDGASWIDTGVIIAAYGATAATDAIIAYIQGNTGVQAGDAITGNSSGTARSRLYNFSDILSSMHTMDITVAGTSAYRGYVASSRTALNLRNIYLANSTTPHASFASDAVVDTGGLPVTSMPFMATNESGSISFPTAKRISFFAFSLGLTAAQSLALYTAVKNYRDCLGGGTDTDPNSVLPNAPAITDLFIFNDVNNGDGTHTVSQSWSWAFAEATVKGYSSPDGVNWTYSGTSGLGTDGSIDVTVPLANVHFKVTTFNDTNWSATEVDSNIVP